MAGFWEDFKQGARDLAEGARDVGQGAGRIVNGRDPNTGQPLVPKINVPNLIKKEVQGNTQSRSGGMPRERTWGERQLQPDQVPATEQQILDAEKNLAILAKSGRGHAELTPGPVDGNLDSKTLTAIASFATENGLPSPMMHKDDEHKYAPDKLNGADPLLKKLAEAAASAAPPERTGPGAIPQNGQRAPGAPAKPAAGR